MTRSPAERHRRIAQSLIAATPADSPNPYITHHLAGHIAEAGAWQDLADAPDVLDRLEPRSVAAEALRAGYGRSGLPDPITATLVARDLLASAAPEDRATVRALTSARFVGTPAAAETPRAAATWSVRWTRLRRDLLPAIVTDCASPVAALRAFTLPDGRQLLAVGTQDGRVRLWDSDSVLDTALPPVEELSYEGSVHTLEIVARPDGSQLLASGVGRTVHLWDPVTRSAVGASVLDTEAGTDGGPGRRAFREPAWKAVSLPEGRPLIAVCDTNNVRLWDPFTGDPVGPQLIGPESLTVEQAITEGSDSLDGVLSPVTLPDGRVLLVVGGTSRVLDSIDGSTDFAFGRLWAWDVATGRLVWGLRTGYSGTLTALTTVSLRDGREALATAGGGGVVRLFDPAGGIQVGEWLHGNGADVVGASTVRLKNGRTALVTVGDDRTVRAWDPATGTLLGAPMSAQNSGVRALTGLHLSDGRSFVAGGGEDGTVQLWNPESAGHIDDPLAGPVDHLVPLPARPGAILQGRPQLASVSNDHTLQLWEADSGLPMARPLPDAPGRPVAVPTPKGPILLALGDGDEPMRLWDPEAHRVVRGMTSLNPLRRMGLIDHATAVAAVPWRGRTAVAVRAGSIVTLWDPASGRRINNRRFPMGVDPLDAATTTLRDGRTVLVTGSKWGIRVWDPRTGTRLAEWTHELVHPTTVTPVTWPGAHPLLAVTDETSTRLVDLFSEDAPRDRVRTTLAVGSEPPMTRGDRPRIYGRHPHAVTGCRTRTGRRMVATGGDEGVLRLWDPETGERETGEPAHALPVGAPINALVVVDGLLVIGSRDGLIALEC
ncbi:MULTISPECIES: WD40 repeat domain-containing protein [unclassified Streptomyces]|uniref:WD40 repeat domain-containing protein n=1 Tax=unclassified Streptomyces TaxID=2593676 RepID=UPI00278BCA30|nr:MULTISPECIES: WD40 repeat domain-containing protein [unclassified Streptomyces]